MKLGMVLVDQDVASETSCNNRRDHQNRAAHFFVPAASEILAHLQFIPGKFIFCLPA